MAFVIERLGAGLFLVNSGIGLHVVPAISEDEAISIVNKLVTEFLRKKIARFVQIDEDADAGVILYEAVYADGTSDYYVSAQGTKTGPHSKNEGRALFLKQIKKHKPKGYDAPPPQPRTP